MRRTALSVAIAAAGLLALAAPAMAKTRNVWPGHSIQRAVNRARPGDTVLVHRGTYHQTVLIHKNGIHLVGLHATILPPKKATGLCAQVSAPAMSGICVFGAFDSQGNPMAPRAENNTISGFKVEHFSGEGIFLFNVENTRITHNISAYNGDYGIVGFDQVGGLYRWNVSHDNVAPGFYLGDSQHAHYVIEDNMSYGNEMGIFVRHTGHALVEHNKVWGNCAGTILLDDGQPGGEHNITYTENRSWANDKACPAGDEGPPLSGIGVAAIGLTDSTISRNVILKNAATGPSAASGGLILLSSTLFGGATDTTNVHVFGNTILGNSPLDVLWDGAGSGNTFNNNTCGSSSPSFIC